MFKEYRKTQIAEMRPITEKDISFFTENNCLVAHATKDNNLNVSISDADLQAGSPKIGDMIARNPKNILDQWLVAEQYFKDNFEPK